jgi:hypothetical protein
MIYTRISTLYCFSRKILFLETLYTFSHMQGHQTASIVFLLLTVLIALAISGMMHPTAAPPVRRPVSEGSCKETPRLAPEVAVPTYATDASPTFHPVQQNLAPMTHVPLADPALDSKPPEPTSGAATAWSNPIGSTYTSAYVPSKPLASAPSTREFDYIITPVR